jgi:nitroreductase
MCEEFLKSRRSIRKFQDKDVPNEVLIKLIEIANNAPNSNNNEPWKFIFIRDKKTKQELSKLHKGASHLADAPIVVAVVAEPDRNPNTWMVDVPNAALYFALAAHCLGLGVGWVASYNDKTASSILGIPSNKVLVTLMSLGYPDYTPKPKTNLKPEDVILYERWS